MDDIQKEFTTKCVEGDLDAAKKLYLKGADIYGIRRKSAFYVACNCGQIDIAKWLYSIDNDIIHINERSFEHTCMKGHFEVAKWLYSLYPKFATVDAFSSACYYGNIDIAKWLYSLDNHIIDKYEFSKFCHSGKIEIAKWLYSLNNDFFDKNAFSYACLSRSIDFAKWIYSLDVNVNIDDAFENACSCNNIDTAKWVYSLGVNNNTVKKILCEFRVPIEIAKWLYSLDNTVKINYNCLITSNCTYTETIEWLCVSCNIVDTFNNDEEINKTFVWAFDNGYFEIVKWLCNLTTTIKITDEMFCSACELRQTDIAKLVYDLSTSSEQIDIHADDDRAFILALSQNLYQTVKWLCGIDQMFIVKNLERIDYKTIVYRLGLSKETSNLLWQINKHQVLSSIEYPEDIVVHALFYYNRITDLERLNLPYVSYEVSEDKIVNSTIKRFKTKSANNTSFLTQ